MFMSRINTVGYSWDVEASAGDQDNSRGRQAAAGGNRTGATSHYEIVPTAHSCCHGEETMEIAARGLAEGRDPPGRVLDAWLVCAAGGDRGRSLEHFARVPPMHTNSIASRL